MTAPVGPCAPPELLPSHSRSSSFARMGHLQLDAAAPETTPAHSSHMAMQVPELPHGTRPVYLAEGGANIVYKIVFPDISSGDGTSARSSKAEQFFRGKLLRLRKSIDSGTPYQETMRNFDTLIRTLFRDDELVDQTLIRLPKGFIARCNEQLRTDEQYHLRPKSRHGVYLSTKEPFGLLITDMTPTPESGACLWEFKPKWLLQSPSAPANAKRCRTCALREMKNYDARKTGESETCSFCPLDLISENFEDVVRATRFLKGAHGFSRVARFLYRNSTLLKLQSYQRQMNAVGLPGLQAHFRERAISMTLRDCTAFVKVPYNELEPLEIRLGDLDFKSGVGGKLQYWREIEKRLIDEGWYKNRLAHETSECALNRPRAPEARPSNGAEQTETA